MYFGEGNSNFLSSYREPSELVILHSVEVLNDKAGDQVDTRHAGWTPLGPLNAPACMMSPSKHTLSFSACLKKEINEISPTAQSQA